MRAIWLSREARDVLVREAANRGERASLPDPMVELPDAVIGRLCAKAKSLGLSPSEYLVRWERGELVPPLHPGCRACQEQIAGIAPTAVHTCRLPDQKTPTEGGQST